MAAEAERVSDGLGKKLQPLNTTYTKERQRCPRIFTRPWGSEEEGETAGTPDGARDLS